MADEPTPTWRDREAAAQRRGVVLDPQKDPVVGVRAFPSVYSPGHLLISGDPGLVLEELTSAANAFGWAVEPEIVIEPGVINDDTEQPRDAGLTRLWILPIEKTAAVPVVDAWRLLQHARRVKSPTVDVPFGEAPPGVRNPVRRTVVDDRVQGGVDPADPLRAVGLDHVLFVDTIGTNRFAKTNPAETNRFAKTNPFVGTESYESPGSGGLEVVTYAGAAPSPAFPVAAEGRRPVVAILDTGCGEHPWFAASAIAAAPTVRRGITPPSGVGVIGIDEPSTDPEAFPDQSGPRDGMIDGSSGHGTFVSGIVRQTGPDADLIAVRVADSDGTVLESELIKALEELRDLVRRSKLVIDVLNLSLGFYHETPEDGLFATRLYDVLADLRREQVIVVCSAGNDATDRPAFPAALWGWPGSGLGLPESGDLAPLISVGALNPNGRTLALYSNIGDWVRVYAPGTSVLSTIPAFQGGVQAGSRADLYDLPRTTIDPDDFTGGFAIWSGTSFAAPYVAGLIAQEIAAELTSTGARPSTAVEDVLTRLVKLFP